MKRFLPIAAIVIVVGALASWLWPEAPAPVAPPAPALAPIKPAPVHPAPAEHEEEKNRMQVTFINHLGDANMKFTVDGIYVCTAAAGKSCYGEVNFGKHVVEALEGDAVVRTLDLTLDKDTANPKVVVCFPTSPDC